MKKTKGHYPYRQVLWFNGAKIIGKADNYELNIILDIIYDDLIKICPEISKKEFYAKTKKIKLFFIEQLPVFSGASGLAIGNRIFVNRELYDLLDEENIEEFKKTYEYSTLFHEIIHFLQSARVLNRFYIGHNLIGFIEGATEKECIENIMPKRSTIDENGKWNFETSAVQFVPSILIMQQLETLYGRDLVKNFTFKLDKKLLDIMSEDLGVDFTLELIDFSAAYAKRKEYKSKMDLEYAQNELMYRYFNNKLDNCADEIQAKELLLKLRTIGNKRYLLKDSKSYEQYYNYFLSLIKERFTSSNFDEFVYIEPEYYVNETFEERKQNLEDSLYSSLYSDLRSFLFDYPDFEKKRYNNISELLARFKEFKLNNYNFFEVTYGDNIFGIYLNSNQIHFVASVVSESEKDNKFYCVGTYNNEKGVYDIKCDYGIITFNTNTSELSFPSDLLDGKTLTMSKTELIGSTQDLYEVFKEIVREEYHLSTMREKILKKITGQVFDDIPELYENIDNVKIR